MRLLVIDIERGAHPVEENRDEAAEYHGKHARAVRRLHVLAAQITLYKLLVATANRNLENGIREACRNKRAGIGNIHRGIPPLGLARLAREGRHFAETAHGIRDKHEHQDAAAEEHAELHHVGPDNRLDAAEPRVENRNRGRHDDSELEVDMQNLRKHERRRIEQDSRTQQQVQAVEYRGKPAHRLGTEAHLEKLIRAADARTAEARDKHEAHDNDTQESADLEHEERHVVAVHVGRRTEEGRRAHGRGDKADAHVDPRDGATAEHVFLEVLVAAGNPEADKQGKQQVCREDNPVKNGKHS